MTEPWSYPIAQAMQRHTGCRFAKPNTAPPSVPEEAPAEERKAPAPSAAQDDHEPVVKI